MFGGEMIRAILAGAKTQTRRTAKPEEFGASSWDQLPADIGTSWARFARPQHPRFGEAGSRLWVRETHAQFAVGNRTGISPQCVAYRATCAEDGSFEYVNNGDEVMHLKVTKWTPAIFMPRWASRITLEVTEVRVQRLQDISEDDARAEGVTPYTPPHGHISPDQRVPSPGFDHARLGDQPHRLPFADLWDRINGDRAPWANNPWVWAISFSRVP